MKKYLALVVFLFMFPGVVFAESSSGYSVITKRDGETSINYRRVRKPLDWYTGVHFGTSFLSWKNEYLYNNTAGSDTFNFKPVIGADIAVGLEFDKKWRAELEFGYIGNYSEHETEYYSEYHTEQTDFNLSTMYLSANGYYELGAGVYIGLGFGGAVVRASLNHTALADVSKTNISPMGAGMIGWTHKLNDKLGLDIRYKFAVFSGSTFYDTNVKVDIGVITDNTLSIGIKYRF